MPPILNDTCEDLAALPLDEEDFSNQPFHDSAKNANNTQSDENAKGSNPLHQLNTNLGKLSRALGVTTTAFLCVLCALTPRADGSDRR